MGFVGERQRSHPLPRLLGGDVPEDGDVRPDGDGPYRRRLGRARRHTLVGALSTYTSMWRYDSYAEREQRRARLQADERWQAFLPKIQPLIHTQQNRILVPTAFSPLG